MNLLRYFLLLNKGLASLSSYRYGQPWIPGITGGKHPPAGVITDGLKYLLTTIKVFFELC
jgi:hypothetical protein